MQEDQVAGDFLSVERIIVLGIEIARIVKGEVPCFPNRLQPNRSEVQLARALKIRKAIHGLGHRPEHRHAQMQSDVPIAQHLPEEQPLVDLEPVLVHLHALAFLSQLGTGRDDIRQQVGRTPCEFIDAQGAPAFPGQRVVDWSPVDAEKAPHCVGEQVHHGMTCRLFLRVAPGFGRKARQQVASQTADVADEMTILA